jgi:Protein of unknown function (DUF3631)
VSGQEFLRDLVPPGQRMELGDILYEVETFIRRYVVLSEPAATIVTVWIAHVFAFAAFEFTAYLIVTSATKRSGKSRLLEVIEVLLGALAVSTANISPASLFRLIDANPGVAVLFDEVDRIPKEKAEDLWGLINSGWREGGKAHRQSGVKMETLTAFSTFSPKVLCGIGQPLPDTTNDRGCHVRMERRLPSESVERLRLRKAGAEVAPIREALTAWANQATIERLSHAQPSFPPGMSNDRLMDVVEPLFAIVDEASGEWPKRVRSAVLSLEEVAEQIAEEELGVLALRHVFDAFTKKQATKLFTDDILAYMVTLDEGPWAEWWGDKVKAGETIGPARRLRRLLDRFDKVKPKTVRIDDVTKKGYDLERIQLAASRYLPVTPVTTVTPLASAVTGVSDVTDTPQDGASNGKGEDTALGLLKVELGAVETVVLDYIDQHRRDGADFTTITAGVRRMEFPPPPGLASWDLATVVQAYGIRHP